MNFNVTWGTNKSTTFETSETNSLEAFAMERWGRTLAEVRELGITIEIQKTHEELTLDAKAAKVAAAKKEAEAAAAAEAALTPVTKIESDPVVTLVPEAEAAVQAAVQQALNDDDDGSEDAPVHVIVKTPKKHRG